MPSSGDEFDATIDATAGDVAAPSPTALARRRYRLGRELARGGMGRIVEAHDLELDREVAIKEILRGSAEATARFRREALITARLQHPAIIPIYQAHALTEPEPYYVMRLVRGESLEAAIDSRKTFRDRLDLLPHMAAATDAMAYAHSQSIIHRDLKPANVLVGRFGETVVIDWGLAKDLRGGDAELHVGPYRSNVAVGETAEGQIMGTPNYMPPEQARGEPVDARADVYSLGAMLHHVLAGEPPFGGRTLEEILIKVMSEPPRALPEEIPQDLQAIVIKAMATEPAARYPTAREMAEDMRGALAGRLVGAHQYSASQLASRWLRRPWVPIALAAALVISLIGASVWILHERSLRIEAEAAGRAR